MRLYSSVIDAMKSVLTMLFAAFLISTSSVWVRLAEMAPSVSGFYRMAIGGVLLIAICLFQKRRLWVSGQYLSQLFLVAVFFAADLWLWHRSIIYVGPGLATVLGNFQVFFMTLFGVLFLNEKIGWRFLLGLALTFFGLFLLVGIHWSELNADYRLGVFYGIATALAYTGFMVSLRRVQGQDGALSAMANLGVMSILCALILVIEAVVTQQSLMMSTWTALGSMLALGVLCQVIGWVLITRTMPLLPVSLVGLLLLLQPAMSMVWDVLFFDRPMSNNDYWGLLLVLSGIYLATLKRRRQQAASQSA